MPQETKAILHDTEHENLQGRAVSADDPVALRKAIELAVDYRGDVTITRKSGSGSMQSGAPDAIVCYIFDVKHTQDRGMIIRAIPKDTDQRVEISFADIQSLAFTGRDTAAGKSFDTWMKNYVKRKLAGEEASIHSESLE